MTKKCKLIKENTVTLKFNAPKKSLKIKAQSIKEAVQMAVIKGKDLSAISLVGVDLSGICLDRAIMDGADFTGSDLSNCNMEFIDAHDATFTNAIMKNCNMYCGIFWRSDFINANLSGSNLLGANMGACDFHNTIVDNVISLVHSCGYNLKLAILNDKIIYTAKPNIGPLGECVVFFNNGSEPYIGDDNRYIKLSNYITNVDDNISIKRFDYSGEKSKETKESFIQYIMSINELIKESKRERSLWEC